MILSVGLDIIELDRIQKASARFSGRFAKKILSADEYQNYLKRKDRLSYLAGRFAAKEATLKALGALFDSGVYLKDITVTNDGFGKPSLRLAPNVAEKLKNHQLHLSITHSHTTAAAVVILEQS